MTFLCFTFYIIVSTCIYSSMHNIRTIVPFWGIGGIMIDYSISRSINLTTVNNYIEMWIHWLRLTLCCQQISAQMNRPMSLNHFCASKTTPKLSVLKQYHKLHLIILWVGIWAGLCWLIFLLPMALTGIPQCYSVLIARLSWELQDVSLTCVVL